MSFAQDISQKEIFRKALEQSEEKFQEIFNNINDAIHLHEMGPGGVPGKFIEVNNVACHMLQYSREELLTLGPLDIVTGYHSRPFEEIIEEIEIKGLAVFETEHRRKDGSVIPVEVSAHVVAIQGEKLVLSVVRDISERKEARQALVDSENRFRRLAENAPDIIFHIAVPGGTFEYVNPAVTTITGYTPEEFKNNPAVLQSMIPTEWRERFTTRWYRTLEGDVQAEHEYPVLTKSGEIRWLHQRNVSVTDQAGRMIALEGIITDVTERKKALEIRSRLAAIVESSADAIIGKTIEGIIIDWNKSAERLYGYSEQEILGKSISLILPPERKEEVQELINKIMRGEQVDNYETERVTKGGRRIHVALTISPILNATGEILGVSTIAHDITRRKRMEKALKEREQLFRSLFDHMIEGHAFHELVYNTSGKPVDYRILEVNTAFETQLGISREYVTGKLSRDAYGVDDPPYLDRYVRVVETGESESFETYYPPMRKTFMISVYSPGKGHFATVFEDITQRKNMEDALRQANKKLQLMSSITRHDILNKLTVLIGYLELEKEKEKTDPAELSYLDKELEAANAIQKQIEFTRYYQNIGVQSPEWQDLAETIRVAVTPIDPGSIRVTIEVPAFEIYADPMLRQVFYNLAENAIRHGETVSRIKFSAEERDDGLVITGEDDGVGIPAGYKERIFDRTFFKHTGLGLYLSREILSITGITIRETGEPGRGARFEVLVPKGMYRSV